MSSILILFPLALYIFSIISDFTYPEDSSLYYLSYLFSSYFEPLLIIGGYALLLLLSAFYKRLFYLVVILELLFLVFLIYALFSTIYSFYSYTSFLNINDVISQTIPILLLILIILIKDVLYICEIKYKVNILKPVQEQTQNINKNKVD